MNLEIDLVDIGIGNTGSVKRCLDRLEITYNSLSQKSQPKGDRPIVLPGVGAFGDVMNSLKKHGLDASIPEQVRKGTPFLGICVGLQVLFDSSEESPDVPGLGILKGEIIKFRQGKVPQIGWNKITNKQNLTSANEGAGLHGSLDEGFVYFVNSYYAKPADPTVTWFESDYYERFCAAVNSKNIAAVQFHPEKSGEFGSKLLKEWTTNACK